MAITFLSFGGGQDSTSLLYEICENPEFRSRFEIDLREFVVMMSPTGNEHDYTYKHIAYIQSYCESKGVPFYHLDYTYHNGKWNDGLIKFYERTNTVGSKVFKKTCTDNLKIRPLYKFVNHYLIERYNLLTDMEKMIGKKTRAKILDEKDPIKLAALYQKKGLQAYAKKHGKINVIIGIAKGEEKRVSPNEQSKDAWMRLYVNKMYPLIDLGWGRQECQDRIKFYGHPVPMPSNCVLCPFMSLQELLYLHRFYPTWYSKWVELEANKMKRFAHLGEKNAGVWANKPLPEMLIKAQSKFGHWSDAELIDYKMSHGHCVKSKY